MKRLALLLLCCACDREIRQQSQVHEVEDLTRSASSTAAVETRREEGPKTTVIEEWVDAGDPVSSPTSTPNLPAIPESSPRPRLLRRTTITQGPVVTDTHRETTRLVDFHADVNLDQHTDSVKETKVGPSPWMWPFMIASAVFAVAISLYIRSKLP